MQNRSSLGGPDPSSMDIILVRFSEFSSCCYMYLYIPRKCNSICLPLQVSVSWHLNYICASMAFLLAQEVLGLGDNALCQ